MKSKTIALISLGLALLTVLVLVFTLLPKLQFSPDSTATGSVTAGNEYVATTTFAASVPVRTLKYGYGALGSVVITGDNTGPFTLYDATTSSAAARASSKATSTLIIADFPASTPEGTYTFDISFSDGLLFSGSGSIATSTITWR